jgi:ABC-type polysaccharide/polyol phosphate transport system ATPase subunit
MSAGAPLIRLDGVSVKYRLAKQRRPSFKEFTVDWLRRALVYEDLWALSDISLTIARGERIGIVGRNGAGKSTLLKVVSQVIEPTVGRATVGATVTPVLDLSAGLDMELSGLENIYLNGLLLGRTRPEIHATCNDIVSESGLGDFIRSPLRNYSSGMVARLAFSVATAWTPEILVLDEVLAVGDAAFVERCQQKLQRFRDSGSTVLVVSHRAREIRDSCDRCLWLEAGTIRADGATDDVLEQYTRFNEARRALGAGA